MALWSCLTAWIGKKKDKHQGGGGWSRNEAFNEGLRALQVKRSVENDELTSVNPDRSVPSGIEKNRRSNVKVGNLESPVVEVAGDVEEAYEGEDEQEEELSPVKRQLSDFDLHDREATACEEGNQSISFVSNGYATKQSGAKSEQGYEEGDSMIRSGHASDPGVSKAMFRTSPKLKRSCSNVETRSMLKKMADQLPSSGSRSFNLEELSEMAKRQLGFDSPRSMMTHGSADRVMLKKRSSSQVLPSRSRKLWWKLFLWSHRNLHRPWLRKSPQTNVVTNRPNGYNSDTVEPKHAAISANIDSSGSYSPNKGINDDNSSWDGFQIDNSNVWPQNQWVAFSAESSSLARVNQWVNDLEMQDPPSFDDNDLDPDGILYSPSTPSPQSRNPYNSGSTFARTEETLLANNIVQSLNSTSTVAHISGIGLRTIPAISHYSSLRSINLSSNCIVHITPGLLPKGLHALNLSRNKISTIEGLRELTRLRILDLSYNRISRIGQGLSNCSLIKELYLAGNKISNVEGLHRLLKLTVLDISFNKITTTKALGQLVANYNSLQALNLLGNPIQNNIGDEQLRKAVCDLLPKLVYLNKQPIKPQRAREVLRDSVARAALGNSSWKSHRKAAKRPIQGRPVSSRHGLRTSPSVENRSKHRSRTHNQHHS